MLRVPWRLPSPSSATATWASLWVSTPRVIVAASVGMHRVTFSSPRSPDEHRAFMFTRAEMRRTPLRWVFYRKAQASIKSRPSRSGGGASDLIDGSPARHSCRTVKIWVRPAGGQSPPIFSQCGRFGFRAEQRGDFGGDGLLDQVIGKHGIIYLLEGALVLLAIHSRRQRSSLLLEEGLRDAPDLAGRDFVALPSGAIARSYPSPLLEEYPALAPGRREHHQRAAADSEHRADAVD